MTRFNHIICFAFAAALALATGALLMFALATRWPQGDPTLIVASAIATALVVPFAATVASTRFVRGGQPVTAWLVCFAVIVAIAIVATLLL